MTTVETHRTEVAAPAAVPYRYGLFSVATPDAGDGERRFELNGITWVSELCTTPGLTTNSCVDPDVVDLEGTPLCVVPVFDQFTVYQVNADSAVKTRTSEAAVQGARDKLTASEQFGVEAALWDDLEAAEPTPIAATSPALALGVTEQALIEAYPATGVIHMSRLATYVLADLLRVEGSRLVTQLGTPVVAGGGYGQIAGAEPATITIFGTGPLVIARSEMQDQPGFDRAINSWFATAYRTYSIGWDCGIVGATATV